MLSWIALILAVPTLLLGLHGLFTSFQSLDTLSALMTGSQGKLFFAIDVPEPFSDWVEWMTFRGFQSFIIPGIFTFCGGWLALYVYNHGLGKLSLPRLRNPWRHNRYSNDRYKAPNWKVSAIRILLNLAILGGLVILLWYGSRVFSHKTNPVIGASLFILIFVVWCLLIWLLRKRYIRYQPSFKISTLVVILVLSVFAFAGVEPLASVKDNAVLSVSGSIPTNAQGQTNSQSVKVGPWLYSLDSVRRSGTSLTVGISIKNNTGQPLVYDSGSVGISYPGLIAVDSYNQTFAPKDDSWYYMRTIYPNETVRGRLQYTLHNGSGDTNLYLGMNAPLFSPMPRQLLFDLK